MTAHGAIIVEDANKPPYEYDGELMLMTGDYYARNDTDIESGLVAPVFEWSGEPLATVIQGSTGTSGFNNATDSSCAPHIFDVEPGKTYRLRVIGTTVLSLVELGIEDHSSNLQVIEADGAYTEPAPIDHIQVATGQRWSYLFKTMTEAELKKAGKSVFWVRYETRLRPTNVPGYAMLRYNGSNVNTPLPKVLPTTSPVQLPEDPSGYLEYTLQPECKEDRESFPKLSEVTRTVTIQVNQNLATGEFVNGTPNGTLIWV